MLPNHRGEIRGLEGGKGGKLVERHLARREPAAVDFRQVGSRPGGPTQEPLAHAATPCVILPRVSGQQGVGDRVVLGMSQSIQRRASNRAGRRLVACRQVQEQADRRRVLELAQQVDHGEAVRLGRSAIDGDASRPLDRRPPSQPGGQPGQGHVAGLAIGQTAGWLSTRPARWLRTFSRASPRRARPGAACGRHRSGPRPAAVRRRHLRSHPQPRHTAASTGPRSTTGPSPTARLPET